MTPTIGSHALLLQMTTNLVHNAIVHNLPEQGTVWVTTSVHPKSVVLTVENTGEKLTPQLVSTLAEPFQRGTERIRTDHAGVGLGLAIVKSITQAHDGTLTLTPRAAGGLRVTVQLPAAPPHAEAARYCLTPAGPRPRADHGDAERLRAPVRRRSPRRRARRNDCGRLPLASEPRCYPERVAVKLSVWVLAVIGHLPITPTRKLPDALVVDVNLPFRRSCTWLACPSVFGIVRENAPWGDAGVLNTLAKNGWRIGPERQSAMS